MAKRVGRVGFGLGQSGRKSNKSFLNGSIKSQVESGWGTSRVDLYFSNNYLFFFEINTICQLFLSSLTVIRFSLVILLPLTNYH